MDLKVTQVQENDNVVDATTLKSVEAISESNGNTNQANIVQNDEQVEAVIAVTPVQTSGNATAVVETSKPMKDFEEYDIAEAWAVCLVTGVIGGHWFYLHQPAKGVLYFCTLGLLGIGYAVDLFRLPLLVQRQRIKSRCKREGEPYLFEPSFLEAYWVCLISGLWGGHHFYLRNFGTGIIYFLTFGFLGFAYVYDLIFLTNLVKRKRYEFNTTYIDKHGFEMWQKAKERNKQEREKIWKSSETWKKRYDQEMILVAAEVQEIEDYQGKVKEVHDNV